MAAKTDMTPKPSNNASAVVFGAGPVGAAIALGLQQRGFEVNVYERRSEAAVTADAGRSINLALSTRGRALLNLLGTYDGLESSLVPMRQRRFSNDTYEKYREPLQSINRNLLTVKNIDYAKKAGVKFIYDSSFEPSMVNRNTGEIVFGDGTTQRPKVIVGCDGVNGKVSHLINTDTKRSRKSEWCYMELTIPPRNPKPQGQYLNKDQFENFLIWPGKAPHNTEFIVGLPNQDGSITLTLFALNEKVLIDNDFSKPIITTEEQLKAHLETTYDDQLHEKMEGTTEDGQNWLNLAAKTGFVPIMLNEHDNLAGELVRSADPNFKSQYVFLFGDAALGMEQFLGLAINAGFEGAHRFLEQFDKRLASIEPSDSFWAGQVGARNILNRGVKALQMGSHKNAASMRDGCDDPLGKAIRETLEVEFGQADITKSGFESTHDWWSFTETPLSVCEGVIDAQDALVEKLKYDIESARTQAELGVFCSILPPALQALFATVDVQGKGLSDKEKESVIEQSASEVVKLIANRNTAIADHAAEVEKCFA